MGLFVGAVHPLGALAVTLATATYLAFGCVLGMVYSLRARTSSRAVVSTLITLVILSGAYLLVFMPWNVRSELTLVGVTPFVEEVVLMSYLDVKWLLDFESPEQRMLNIGLTCVLSVALYAGGDVRFGVVDSEVVRPGDRPARLDNGCGPASAVRTSPGAIPLKAPCSPLPLSDLRFEA